MDKTIDLLKDAIASQGIAIDNDAMFELVAESCSGCCAIGGGGNTGCKPATAN